MSWLAVLIVVATMFLDALDDARREQATEWQCPISVEEALASDEPLPPECIADPGLVADVLIEMGY